MIGGCDMALDGVASSDEIALLIRLICEAWPECVVESGDGSRLVNGREDAAQIWAIPAELFIYDSREAYESWTSDGLTDGNADRMISVNAQRDAISFVVNAPESETARHVRLIMQAIREERLARHRIRERLWTGSHKQKWLPVQPQSSFA